MAIYGPYLNEKHNRMQIEVDGKTKLYSRYLMEQYLGRELQSWEYVHHINRDQTDDRIKNLKVIDGMIHRMLHTTGNASRNPGSKNGRSKLTEEIVKQIRIDYKKYPHQRMLQQKYKVSAGTISLIINNKIWKEV